MSEGLVLTARSVQSLKSLGNVAPRSLERGQEKHPDHRVYSSQGLPFPCPTNGFMDHKAFTDIDFRNTKPDDLPTGMVAMKKVRNPSERAPVILGRSKWDFQYMASGSSIAVKVGLSRYNELYQTQFNRIRNNGIAMWRYQRDRGYIDPGFLVQTSDEDISIGKLRNGDDILAPHVVFWRIDGTRIDPNWQGN